MADGTMLKSSLQDDMVFEILSWVPVKSVCRFRCVSKAWHALISGPAFVTAHRARARAEPLLLFLGDSSCSDLRLVDMDGNLVRAIKRAGLPAFGHRLDGTVCLIDDYWATTFGTHKYVVDMIDLSTGNVTTKTSAELNHELLNNLNVGCAAPSDTYKLVCLNGAYAEQPCKVLTLEDGARWRHVQSPSELATAGFIVNSGITVDGVMHFLYKFMLPHMDGNHCILRFDLESEEWRSSFKRPLRLLHGASAICMVKLNNSLCIVQQCSINKWLIWLLRDPAKGTWVKAYTIPTASPVDSVMPLMVMRDGRKLLFCAYNIDTTTCTTTRTLQVYNPLTRKCTHHPNFASNLLGNVVSCNLHLDSFVSPKISFMPAPSVLSRLRSNFLSFVNDFW